MGDIFGTFAGAGAAMVNNSIAQGQGQYAREENFIYGEKAARNADKRTRQLYNDLYSPQAQIQQLKDAGLSPALMYGGGSGGSGQAGAMGHGAAGIAPQTFGVNPLEMAQIGLIGAQTEKVKEETKNTQEDTKIKEIEKDLKSIEFSKLKVDSDALFEYVNVDGKRQSFYEFAGGCSSYENFLSQLRKHGIDYDVVNTEQGQRTLREIYMSRKQLSAEIATLSEEEISSNFQIAIVNALKKEGYIDENAHAIVQDLRTSIATNELTESQKNAWNDLLNKLEQKNPMYKDIAIILGLIVTEFGGKMNMSLSRQQRNINVTK